MPEPPSRPRLRDRYNKRRAAVLGSAAQVYADRGYHATSINELVEATGLQPGGLYHYIDSKENLLVSLFEQLTEPLAAITEEALETPDRPDRQLRALVRGWLRHVLEFRYHVIVFGQEWRSVRPDERFTEVRARLDTFDDVLGGLFDRMAADGIGPADPDLGRRALTAMVDATAQWYEPGDKRSPEDLAKAYCDLVIGSGRRRKTAAAAG
ncbi:TetR/AcrR family transcriptional regulator [Amycolatopsis jejuensis]|uniref:TetR/AcrR family transcriptional regulator n=1 Tax=Amycolatopsis jejuensis TaxID=330084 RepID=UPI0005270649|nr:TetR/AcrR family transcriptional regulator [Amycolatopsis jejuensis]